MSSRLRGYRMMNAVAATYQPDNICQSRVTCVPWNVELPRSPHCTPPVAGVLQSIRCFTPFPANSVGNVVDCRKQMVRYMWSPIRFQMPEGNTFILRCDSPAPVILMNPSLPFLRRFSVRRKRIRPRRRAGAGWITGKPTGRI